MNCPSRSIWRNFAFAPRSRARRRHCHHPFGVADRALHELARLLGEPEHLLLADWGAEVSGDFRPIASTRSQAAVTAIDGSGCSTTSGTIAL